MLKLVNFSIMYDDKYIMQDINFVSRSNVINIYGKNGSGKTALIDALLGLIKYEGTLFFKDTRIASLSQIVHPVLYIGHSMSISPDLTVYENLDLWSSIYASQLMMPAAISYWGLDDYCNFPVKHLSIGTIRKVELAKLGCCSCKLWVLDEPDANLDQESKTKLNNMIQTRAESGGMVIYTSHEKSNNNCIDLN